MRPACSQTVGCHRYSDCQPPRGPVFALVRLSNLQLIRFSPDIHVHALQKVSRFRSLVELYLLPLVSEGRHDQPVQLAYLSRSFITLPFLARDRKAVEVVQIILESVLLRREKDMLDSDGKRIVQLPPKEVRVSASMTAVEGILTVLPGDFREIGVLSPGTQDLRLAVLGCEEGLRAPQ